MRIIKQKRKTLSLKIDKNGDVTLKVPNFVSDKVVNEFLYKHKSWILEKQKLQKENIIDFSIWKKFLFFWEYFELKSSSDKKFYFDNKYFYTFLNDKEEIKKEFIKFYKTQAKIYISKKIVEFCLKLNIDFNNLKITSAKSRWWSCNSKKNISFSFRLILAPKNSIDYVIIHELAHLIEMNHSKKFWDLVDNYCRQVGIWDFKKCQEWLKQNSLKTNF